MGEKRKLLAALDAHKGRNLKLERQKKLQKQAEKRKRSRQRQEVLDEENVSDGDDGEAEINEVGEEERVNGDGWETEESENVPAAVCVDCPIQDRSCSILIHLR